MSTSPLRVNEVRFPDGANTVHAYDVKSPDYGAVGNNVADDTAAINAAITAANTAGGGTVHIPPGTYKVSAALFGIASAANVQIVGAGPATVINATIAGGGTSAPVFSFPTCTGCAVGNMKITGAFGQGVFINAGSQNRVFDMDISGATNSTTVNSGAVVLQDATHVVIERVYAHGNGVAGNSSAGIDIGTYSGSTQNKNVTIRDCRATSTGVAVNIGLWDVSHALIEGNYTTGAILNQGVTTSGGYGIMVYATASPVEYQQNRIANNHVEATQGSGIYVQGSPSTTVVGNRINGVATAQTNSSLQVGGIAIGSASVSFGDETTVTGCAITGNTITGGGAQAAGISAGGANNVISSNVISGTTDAGIMLRDFHRGVVSGNTMQSCGGGIVNWDARNNGAGDTLDFSSITGNTIVITNAFGGGAQPGISLYNASTNVIMGNTIRAPGAQGILIQNSDTITIAGNNINASGQSAPGGSSSDGIALLTGSDIRIIGNLISSGQQRYGVSSDSGSLQVQVAQNWINGASTAPYSISNTAGTRLFVDSSQTIAAAASITIDPTKGDKVRITLSATAITSLTVSAGVEGQVIQVAVVEDGTGTRTIPTTWTNVTFAGGTYTATATASKTDVLTLKYDTTATKWQEVSRAMNQ